FRSRRLSPAFAHGRGLPGRRDGARARVLPPRAAVPGDAREVLVTRLALGSTARDRRPARNATREVFAWPKEVIWRRSIGARAPRQPARVARAPDQDAKHHVRCPRPGLV